jgi:hypothetical protein
MHSPSLPHPYSLANFFLGCQITIRSRAPSSGEDTLPSNLPSQKSGWARFATGLFALLAGLALLLAIVRVVGTEAPAAVDRMAPAVSTRGFALFSAILVLAAFAGVVYLVGRRAVRFYARMCRIGQAHRTALVGVPETVRCYTR